MCGKMGPHRDPVRGIDQPDLKRPLDSQRELVVRYSGCADPWAAFLKRSSKTNGRSPLVIAVTVGRPDRNVYPSLIEQRPSASGGHFQHLMRNSCRLVH